MAVRPWAWLEVVFPAASMSNLEQMTQNIGRLLGDMFKSEGGDGILEGYRGYISYYHSIASLNNWCPRYDRVYLVILGTYIRGYNQHTSQWDSN